MAVYIELFHGRKSPKQNLDGWGSQGPVFGPYDVAHMTYASHIRMLKEDGTDHEIYISKDKLILYNDVWYGDVTIMSTRAFRADKELKKRLEEYSEDKATSKKIPGWNIEKRSKVSTT